VTKLTLVDWEKILMTFHDDDDDDDDDDNHKHNNNNRICIATFAEIQKQWRKRRNNSSER